MKTIKEMMEEREWADMSIEEKGRASDERLAKMSEREQLMLEREVIEELRAAGKLNPNFKG